MADIKTRDAVKGTIKTLDKATVAGQKMKEATLSCLDVNHLWFTSDGV